MAPEAGKARHVGQPSQAKLHARTTWLQGHTENMQPQTPINPAVTLHCSLLLQDSASALWYKLCAQSPGLVTTGSHTYYQHLEWKKVER
jgi:hypothetical protein